MTNHTDLIARLRKDDLFWEAPITCRSEAAYALQAAQAEIEAQQHRIQALWMERDVVRVERDKALARLAEVEGYKDGAYTERNQLVSLLSKLFPSGTKRTAIEGWSEDWHGCVYIDLPTGQASWHYHDSQAHLFAHLPPYAGTWDGHTTEQKYERIAGYAAAGASPVQPSQDLQSVADALTIEQLNDKVERLMAVQPSQAPQVDEAMLHTWLEMGAPESFKGVTPRDMIIALQYFFDSRQPPLQSSVNRLASEVNYVQPVPEHCDRITWRGRYFSLPIKQPSQTVELSTEQLLYVQSALKAVEQYGNIFRYERHQVIRYEKIVDALAIVDAAINAKESK